MIYIKINFINIISINILFNIIYNLRYIINTNKNQNILESKMSKALLSIIAIGTAIGFSLTPSAAEALKVQFQPNITFRQSYARPYLPPRQVVREYQDVYFYHDPLTHNDYYYYYPVQEVLEYYPTNPRPV